MSYNALATRLKSEAAFRMPLQDLNGPEWAYVTKRIFFPSYRGANVRSSKCNGKQQPGRACSSASQLPATLPCTAGLMARHLSMCWGDGRGVGKSDRCM